MKNNITFTSNVEDNNIVHVKEARNTIENYNFTSEYSSPPSNIFTLAKAFLSISGMTNKKLQKLCYYAKAWYLALYDHNLISEQFEAWVHGAVHPALYHQYKKYGYGEIPKNLYSQDIPEEFMSFAKEVYDAYGHLTGDELEMINHQEDPWIEARKGFKPWESCSNNISEESMKIFYRKMIS